MKELENTYGYNLVNFTILPHWGSADFKKLYLESRLAMAYKADQVPLVLLTDKQYIWVKNDTHTIVDLG